MKKFSFILLFLLLFNVGIYAVNASSIEYGTSNMIVLERFLQDYDVSSNNNNNNSNNNNNNSNNKNSNNKNSNSSSSNSNNIDISHEKMTCRQLIGENLYKVLHLVINAIRVGAAIAAVIIIMLAFLPVISSGDASEMKKATKKMVSTIIVLVLVEFIPIIVGVVGKIAGFDLTCL